MLVSLFAFDANSSSAAVSDCEPGSLFKLQGLEGAAVYQIGTDCKKYIFNNEKTFKTWKDDFSEVQAVSQDTLDSYAGGGSVTVRPGTRLLTHINTAKTYAVGANGQLIYIPNENTARRLYGDDWASFVIDIDPGFFSQNYTVSDGELSEDNLPEGSLVMEQNTNKYYLIENGLKRRVHNKAFAKNRLHKKKAIMLNSLTGDYEVGPALELEEEDINTFEPGSAADKVIICHTTRSLSNPHKTIRVSSRALAAHLAHGDTEGECDSDDYVDEDNVTDKLPDIRVDDITIMSLSALGTHVTSTLTVYIENSGEVTLTDTTGVLNFFKSFEDFESTVMPASIPVITEDEPFEPGNRVGIVWNGYFTTTGEKLLAFTVDNADELEEADETNNEYSETITIE